MKERKNVFPAVMTIVDFLGIESGTVLRFDKYSSKYVTISEEEDLGEEYFYSGYAVAIDPYLVDDNIGTVFTYIETATEDTKPEEIYEFKTEDKETELEEKLPEMVEDNTPHALVVDCDCGHRTLIKVIEGAGINFLLMAETEDSMVELSCAECGSKMKLWFAPDKEVSDELIKEESN